MSDDTIKARYNGYCSTCYYTIWRGEVVMKNIKGFIHCDCIQAIADKTPRRLNPGVESIIGKLDKSIIKKKAKRFLAQNDAL